MEVTIAFSYLRDIRKCDEVFKSHCLDLLMEDLVKKRIALGKEYKIIMWDVLSGDFDTNLNGEDKATRLLSIM